MHRCSFCSQPVSLAAYPFCLCASCRRQLLSLSPQSRTYPWYAAAVRRALFPDSSPVSAKAR